jgi:hypothetical protein
MWGGLPVLDRVRVSRLPRGHDHFLERGVRRRGGRKLIATINK